MTKRTAGAGEVNTLLYRALQREFRNLVVDLIRKRLLDAYPDEWPEHLFRGITDDELTSIHENVARTRGSGVVEPPVSDDFDLVDIGHFRNIFEANRHVLVPGLDDNGVALLGKRLGELKTIRNPLSHPSGKDLDVSDAIRAVSTAIRVLEQLALPTTTIRPIHGQLFRIGAGRGSQPGPKPRRLAPLRPRALPPLLITLRGRELELTKLLSMLRKPGVRQVTITGLGGIGKTSLAVRVAEELRRPKGGPLVGFAELEDVSGTAAVESGISAALGVRKVAEIPHDRDVVVVLDNFEHLLDCRSVITALIKVRPRLRLLVTSRAALGLRGEQLLELTGLPYPSPNDDVPLDDLTDFGAVALFCDRARAAHSSFRLTAADAPHIIRLCQMVGGLPLSIEILARKVRSTPLADMPREISEILAIENTDDVPYRQRSLQATFVWSEDRLSPGAAAVWRRLSLVPTHDRASARLACDLGGDMTAAQVDAAVDELVDASLLNLDSDGVLRMHPATSSFGCLRLDEAGETVTMAEHLADLVFESELRSASSIWSSWSMWSPEVRLDPRELWRRVQTYLAARKAGVGPDSLLKAAIAVHRLLHGGVKIVAVDSDVWDALVPPLYQLIEECANAAPETLSAAYREFTLLELEREDDELDAAVVCLEGWEHSVRIGDRALGLLILTEWYDLPWLTFSYPATIWMPWAENLLTNGTDREAARSARLMMSAVIMECTELAALLDPIDTDYMTAVAEAGVVMSQAMDSPEQDDYLVCLTGLHLTTYVGDDFGLFLEVMSWPEPPSQDDSKIRDFKYVRRATRARLLATAAHLSHDANSTVELVNILLERGEEILTRQYPTGALEVAGALGALSGLQPAQEQRRQAIMYRASEGLTEEAAAAALDVGVDQGLFGVVLSSFPGVEELVE